MAVNIESLTSKKVGGIPVIWIVLGVVVVALYGALKLKPAPDISGDTESDSPDIQGDTDVDTSQPVFAATPTIVQPTGTVSSVSGTPMPDTDDAWSRRAIDWLRQNGYSLEIATSAITKYLNGEALTMTEAHARDAAVQQFGIPPETIPGTSTIPNAPTSNPTSPTATPRAAKQGIPPTTHVVRGQLDDSSGELAALYYGVHGAGSGANRLIESYNPTLRPLPGPWKVGTHVVIPAYVTPVYYKATSANRNAADIARRNGTTRTRVLRLNPGKNFPVAVGTRVRVR